MKQAASEVSREGWESEKDTVWVRGLVLVPLACFQKQGRAEPGRTGHKDEKLANLLLCVILR